MPVGPLQRRVAKPLRAEAANQATSRSSRKRAKAPARVAAMRLAAEVDALAAELEASRARIAELEARVDIDPLTDDLNRRGFERELKRSLAYVKRYGAQRRARLSSISTTSSR